MKDESNFDVTKFYILNAFLISLRLNEKLKYKRNKDNLGKDERQTRFQ